MSEYNNITNIIKILFNQFKKIAKNLGIFYFINLIALHSILMLFIVLVSEWINNNIDIFNFSLPMIVLRLSLFSLFLGLWTGYFKIIFNYIDYKLFYLSNIFKNYHLLPKILFLKTLSYLTMTPLILFIIYKFPYEINKYGTNIQLFLTDVGNKLIITYSDQISWALYSSYISFQEVCFLIVLCLFPIWYSIRFWCAELLIIDREMSIKNSLLTSYSLTKNIGQLILLGFILICINLFFAILGYIFFIIGLTISYILILLYYRFLNSSILNK